MTIINLITKINKHDKINKEILTEYNYSDFNNNGLYNSNEKSMAISFKQSYCNMFRPFLYSIFPLSYKEK
ncbi:hypothetical protein DDB_G0281509 [Dictyostelium discoideum AX4]|uniref:Uncharacterized protein n=1 Tax=Dictyostelium discoideum TaxID=44689 RepID=Q54TT5_DICDI|nr:hypothetical protein DDB_G0281509 [Dictyostelium discoideum AX4]EAL66736.1 hypothetical protein DDB_G0281509 [Dictyostelium discoideum AX4]|eukprot:XP_640726.1 hypothetical protein DDB_G0281509 [Dictyostelium discoideum AX4]